MFIPVLRWNIPDGLWQSGLTIGGNTLATGFSAIALILISRLLGPTQFGEFSVGFAIILMINKLNDAGLNATLAKFVPPAGGDHDAVNRIFSYTIRLKIGISILILGASIFVSPMLVRYLHFPHPLIIYAAFGLSIVSSWYEQLLGMLQALHRFSEAVIVNALQSATKLIGAVLLSIFAFSRNVPIFAFYMIAPIVPLLCASWLLPRWQRVMWKADFSPERKMILQMAKHSAVGFIAAGLIENVDILFVQRYLSAYETGLLAGVMKIATMLLLVAYSLGNVLYPRVAKYHHKVHLSAYLKKASGLLLLTAVGFMAFLPFTSLLIRWSIGPEYLPGLGILTVLAAGSFLTIATIPFMALFYTLKANWYFSVSGLGQLAIIVVGDLWLVPQYGLIAAAWVRFSMRVFTFVFTVGLGLYLYWKQYGRQALTHSVREFDDAESFSQLAQ